LIKPFPVTRKHKPSVTRINDQDTDISVRVALAGTGHFESVDLIRADREEHENRDLRC
jgi:hypothetical protein